MSASGQIELVVLVGCLGIGGQGALGAQEGYLFGDKDLGLGITGMKAGEKVEQRAELGA